MPRSGEHARACRPRGGGGRGAGAVLHHDHLLDLREVSERRSGTKGSAVFVDCPAARGRFPASCSTSGTMKLCGGSGSFVELPVSATTTWFGAPIVRRVADVRSPFRMKPPDTSSPSTS